MSPEPGWHPDPAGRHQHRFWDGATWTAHVSDDGTPSVDPLVPPASVTATPTSGAPAAPPLAPAAPKRGGPLAIGLIAVLAVAAVAAAAVVVGASLVRDRDQGPTSGPGDFVLSATTDRLTVHHIPLQAGDAYAWRITGASGVRVAEGSSRADITRLDDHWDDEADLGDLFDDMAETNAGLFEGIAGHGDLVDAIEGADPGDLEGWPELPGYDGLAWYLPDGGEEVSEVWIAPIDLTLSVVVIAERGTQEIELSVRTRPNPLTTGDLSTEAHDDLMASGFFSDFWEEVEDEWGIDLAGEPLDDESLNDTSFTCTTERRTLETAIAAYHATYGTFPSDLDDLEEDGWLRDVSGLAYEWDYQPTTDRSDYALDERDDAC